MKHGIYYAYWEKEWNGDYQRYIEKAAHLGFDILEIACSPIPDYSKKQLKELKDSAKNNGIILTAGHGPSAMQNVAAAEKDIREKAFAFWDHLFHQLEQLDIHLIGGALYSYWPVDYTKPVDKEGDWLRGVEGIARISKTAAECGITLGLEVLNRFENHVLNTAEEGVDFVEQVGAGNVKVMLDTFHMNIEENSISGAIRTAGKYLGHVHTGECNRMVPGKGRIPWREIGEALKEVGYQGAAVMEPFVQRGGKVGNDIKIWRDMLPDVSEEILDKDAKAALEFQRYMLD